MLTKFLCRVDLSGTSQWGRSGYCQRRSRCANQGRREQPAVSVTKCAGNNKKPKVEEYMPPDRPSNVGCSEKSVSGTMTGIQRLYCSKTTKGLAFNHPERQILGIHGLQPHVVRSIEDQVLHCHRVLSIMTCDLDKYIYLNTLASRNLRLFYRVLMSDIAKLMPIVYTPTVGLACENYSLLYEYPCGLFITIKDKGHVYDVLKNWPETDVRAIIVTDGERILGLGDLGANGMGISVSKLVMLSALAGVPPEQCLPITLDVGTNNEKNIKDQFYIGLKQKRTAGKPYDDFIDEFMAACVRRFGANILIQFEDFGNENAFRLLKKYRDAYCVFNGDIQGTGSVALAGLLAAEKLTNRKLMDHKILLLGAGEAGLGIAQACLMAMQKEGLCAEEAKRNIWLFDSKGLIVKNRPQGGITAGKAIFAQEHCPISNFTEAIKQLEPSVLIGVAATPGSFTQEMLQYMATFNERPIIFALSNPTYKAECTAEQAYNYTKGKAIFASGSPFAPVKFEGRSFHPGQANNAYIFPGVALGILAAGLEHIPDEVFFIAAKRLASLVSQKDLDKGRIFPPLEAMQACSVAIAEAILAWAIKKNLATINMNPGPKDKVAYIRSLQFNSCYPPIFPDVYPVC